MKKILMILSTILLFGACTSDKDTAAPDGEISLDKPGLLFEQAGGQVEVTVTSGGEWRLAGKKTWCKPSVVSGKSGDKVIFVAEENPGEEDRTIIYTFICGNRAVDFEVSQSKELILKPVRDVENIGPKGGIVTIRVRTNAALEIEIPEEALQWISPVDNSSENPSGAEYIYLQFAVTENLTYGDRNAEITLRTDGQAAPVTINQAKNLSITVSPQTTEVPEAGGSVSFEVSANMEFEISMSALTQTFVTKTGETSRVEGNLTITTLTFSVARNDVMTRKAKISFKSNEGGITSNVSLNQTGTHSVLVKIPDANFRKKLIQNKYIKDASIENCELTWEGLSTTSMNIGYANIASLEGIEAFIGLEKFDVSSSNLVKIDMSKNINLKTLNCTLNALNELVLGDTKVETINLKDGLYHNGASWGEYIKPTSCTISGTYLKSLDISMSWYYNQYDDLQSLDVSGCPALETLQCIRTDEKLKTLFLAPGQEITNLSKSDFTTIVRK